MDKVYKNVNMIRTNHNISRVIRFDRIDDLLAFLESYDKHFEELKSAYQDERTGKLVLYFTIKAETWNEIEKENEDNIVRDNSFRGNRRRFWFWRKES